MPSKICCKCVERANATHSFIQEVLLAQEVFGIFPAKMTGPTNRYECENVLSLKAFKAIIYMILFFSVMYGGVTISSMNQAAINVPSTNIQESRKQQNVSDTLKKLKKMQTANLTISKTIVQGPKLVRKCKIEPKSYREEDEVEEEEEEEESEYDVDKVHNVKTDPRASSDSDDNYEIDADDDDDEDYIPAGKKSKTNKVPQNVTGPNKKMRGFGSNTNTIFSSMNLTLNSNLNPIPKFKAIKINAPPVFLCMKCKNRFDSLIDLKQHVYEKNACTITQLTCKVCDRSFENKKKMAQHMKIHEEKSKIICDKCGKIYSNQFNLENHKSAQHGEYLDEYQNVYKCRICDTKFNNRTDLYSHMKTHTKDNQQLLCDTCGKCFTNSHNLKSHMRIHQDIRPHACTLCPKRFRTRLLLKQHLHVHTGIKEFQCMLCMQSFAKQDSLRIHNRKRHSDAQFDDDTKKKQDPVAPNLIQNPSEDGEQLPKVEIKDSML